MRHRVQTESKIRFSLFRFRREFSAHARSCRWRSLSATPFQDPNAPTWPFQRASLLLQSRPLSADASARAAERRRFPTCLTPTSIAFRCPFPRGGATCLLLR